MSEGDALGGYGGGYMGTDSGSGLGANFGYGPGLFPIDTNPLTLAYAIQMGNLMSRVPEWVPFGGWGEGEGGNQSYTGYTQIPAGMDPWAALTNWMGGNPDYTLDDYQNYVIANQAFSNMPYDAWMAAGAPAMPSWMNWATKIAGKLPLGTFGSGASDILLPALRMGLNDYYSEGLYPSEIGIPRPYLGPFLGGVVQGIGGAQDLLSALGYEVAVPVDRPLTGQQLVDIFGLMGTTGGTTPGWALGGSGLPFGMGPNDTMTLNQALQPFVADYNDIAAANAGNRAGYANQYAGQGEVYQTQFNQALQGLGLAQTNTAQWANPQLNPAQPWQTNTMYDPTGGFSGGNSQQQQIANSLLQNTGDPMLWERLASTWKGLGPGVVESQYGQGTDFANAYQQVSGYMPAVYGNDPWYQVAGNVASGFGTTQYPWIGSQSYGA